MNYLRTTLATHCISLQHTAMHCTALQCTALHCNAMHCTRMHCNRWLAPYSRTTPMHIYEVPLQHTATHCNTLQHTATHCKKLQHTLQQEARTLFTNYPHAHLTATHCNVPQRTATHTATHAGTGGSHPIHEPPPRTSTSYSKSLLRCRW